MSQGNEAKSITYTRYAVDCGDGTVRGFIAAIRFMDKAHTEWDKEELERLQAAIKDIDDFLPNPHIYWEWERGAFFYFTEKGNARFKKSVSILTEAEEKYLGPLQVMECTDKDFEQVLYQDEFQVLAIKKRKMPEIKEKHGKKLVLFMDDGLTRRTSVSKRTDMFMSSIFETTPIFRTKIQLYDGDEQFIKKLQSAIEKAAKTKEGV